MKPIDSSLYLAGGRRSHLWPAVLIAAASVFWGGISKVAMAEDPCTDPTLRVRMLAADCSAQSIAAAVDRHYNSLKSLKADFSQRYAGMGMTRRETGTLLLKKPGRMLWSYSQPAGKVFVIDGKYAYLFGPGDTQVQRVAAKQLDDLRSPLRFLLGHTQLAKEMTGLTAIHVGPPGAAGDGLIPASVDMYWLYGVPKGMEKRVEKMILRVARDGSIYQIEVHELDGAETLFTLLNEKSNVAAPDSAFIFHAPKGVPVVDSMPPI